MKRVFSHKIYDSDDFNYLINNKSIQTTHGGNIYCSDITKQIARLMYRQFCGEFGPCYKAEFNIDESKFNKDEYMVEFNRGEIITAYDFFKRVSLPFTPDFRDDAFDDLNKDEVEDLTNTLNFYKEWNFVMDLDDLPSELAARDPFLAIQYVGYDKSIRTFITHHYKNPDWFELLERFFHSFCGIKEYFVYFADVDCGEFVTELYTNTTCGIKVDVDNKTMTFYDKKTALNALNNFGSLTHHNGWVNQHASKYYSQSYRSTLGCKDSDSAPYYDLCKVILDDKTVVLDIDNMSTDEIVSETLRLVDEYLKVNKDKIVELKHK